MATRITTVTEVLSDISGKEATETIEFAVGGVSYALDATDEEAKEFHAMLAPYIAVAEVKKGRKTKPSDPNETAAIRQWAVDNDYEISARGRIPNAIIEEYREAHKRGRRR